MTADVHMAELQLFALCDMSPMSPASFLVPAEIPCLCADAVKPANMAALAAISLDSSSNSGMFFCLLRLLSVALMVSCSSSVKSLCMDMTLRSLSLLFPLNMSASCADASKNKA
eukprot:CAMPEP_0180789398 /NCGR_PEP_ID=MMETSP1038_2-20121128/52601_1 /TAXON_ID=632150 /ORGANISM="Azadinium spinosum, Strain 3D9" /LENGTH=113 /DNA_ID=CAMNT_0022827161 /DNA_START=41 /DNA_END=382 /DNA_ORIENTATION=+